MQWRPNWAELFSIDLRSLAVFRIVCASLILFDLAMRAPYVAVYYSDEGLVPRALLDETFGLPSLYNLSGSPEFAGLLIAITAVFALMLLLGFQTRFATVALFVLMASLLNRNPWAVNGGDKLMRLLLFWSIFLPLGARFSLDARRRGPARENSVLSVASGMLLAQSAALYVAAGLNKTGPMWSDGTALFRSLSQEGHGRPLGELLYGFPQMAEWMTFLIPPFEILGPLLLFFPVRTIAVRIVGILVFTGFMMGLGSSLRLYLFPFVSCLALIPFVPGVLWDRLAARAKLTWAEVAGERGAAPMRANPAASLIVAAVFVMSVLIGIMQHTERSLLPDGIHQIGLTTGLYQNWEMYADAGETFNKLEVVAIRADGSRVLVPGDSPAELFEGELAFMSDERGFLYMENAARLPEHQMQYLRWLCDVIAGEPASKTRVMRVALRLKKSHFLDEGGLGEPRFWPLARLDCDRHRRVTH